MELRFFKEVRVPTSTIKTFCSKTEEIPKFQYYFNQMKRFNTHYDYTFSTINTAATLSYPV